MTEKLEGYYQPLRTIDWMPLQEQSNISYIARNLQYFCRAQDSSRSHIIKAEFPNILSSRMIVAKPIYIVYKIRYCREVVYLFPPFSNEMCRYLDCTIFIFQATLNIIIRVSKARRGKWRKRLYLFTSRVEAVVFDLKGGKW